MLNTIYQKFKLYFVSKTLQFSNSPLAYPFLFVICLIEAIIFPLPQEIIMIPMMAVNKAKIYMIAFVCLAGSLAGAVIAYFIGLFLFESLGMLILETLHMNIAFYDFVSDIEHYGFLYVFIGGFTPLPFKVVTLSSGFLNINFLIFILACILSRSIRFFLIGFLIKTYGEQVMLEFEKRLTLYSIFFIIIILLIIFYIST